MKEVVAVNDVHDALEEPVDWLAPRVVEWRDLPQRIWCADCRRNRTWTYTHEGVGITDSSWGSLRVTARCVACHHVVWIGVVIHGRSS